MANYLQVVVTESCASSCVVVQCVVLKAFPAFSVQSV